MIGLDSNIVLRWIVDDGRERHQTELAARALQSLTVHISILTLAEVIWVLRSRYGIARSELIMLIDTLVGTANVVVQHVEAVRAAARDAEKHGGDLPDHLLAALNQAAGCDYTLTFDRKAARSPKFKRLTPEEF